ncbi:MAG TPA: peptidoglycan-associated lipoprotein Pal [Caulobacteraceae bacterium]
MNVSMRNTVKLVVVVLAAAAFAGCASHPKLAGPAPTGYGPHHEGGYGPPPSSDEVSQGEEPAATGPGSARDFVINAGDLVYFDFDSYGLRDDARQVLDAQAGWLRRYPQVRVRIEGNCDERGTREYNFALGARRADSIRQYLVGRGIEGARIETISYGKERPIDPGDDDAALAKNRNGHTVITGGAR